MEAPRVLPTKLARKPSAVPSHFPQSFHRPRFNWSVLTPTTPWAPQRVVGRGAQQSPSRDGRGHARTCERAGLSGGHAPPLQRGVGGQRPASESESECTWRSPSTVPGGRFSEILAKRARKTGREERGRPLSTTQRAHATERLRHGAVVTRAGPATGTHSP